MKKTIFTVLGITVFAITLNAQNLMKNPSFETFDWEAPDATATNWHYDIGKTGAQVLKDESGAYSGATGLELISTGVERAVITQDFIAVKGNTNYVLTIIGSSLRNDANGNMAAFLTGDQWSSEGAWLANLPFIQFPLSDYQEYAQVVNSFTTHADAVRIKVHIGYTEAGQKGTTYFDDVYLAEGTVPTTKIPAVQNIALDATTNTLTWKAPTTGNPVDYRIYMGTTPSFAITPNLLLWHTTETTFTETNIDNTAGKYFAVVPVGEGGFEGVPAYFPSNGAGLKKVVNNTTRISPNPAVDEITIEANDNQCNIISIYDILGKKVLEIPLKANSTIVNISELSKGNYIVKVGNEFHKLIKK